jgi:peptide/nickel transport system ATP-binding protein
MIHSPEPLLSVKNLTLDFADRFGTSRVVEDVSFELSAREFIGVVGESGSGKSVTAHAIMGVLDTAARVIEGEIRFRSTDLLAADRRSQQTVRAKKLAMIFQNPVTALDPITPVGDQIARVLRRHSGLPRKECQRRAIEMLEQVRIADPVRCAASYPFQLSGGMCQRVMIAIALACSPSVLIADEPTTSLDVTVQAAIMDSLRELTRDFGMAVLLISHDLRLAAAYCNRMIVMHAGHIVEMAPTEEIFARPRHPYTAALLAATPTPVSRLAELNAIPGSLPERLPGGAKVCRFLDRCASRQAGCERPALPYYRVGAEHWVACWQHRHAAS